MSKLNLQGLEVSLDFNLTEFEKKLEKVIPQFNKLMEGFEKLTAKAGDSVDKNLNFQKTKDQVTSQFEQLNQKVGTVLTKIEDSASKSSANIGKNMSEGFSKTRKSVTKEIQAMLDEMDAKMQQAEAQDKKIELLKHDQSKAKRIGDEATYVKLEGQIARAQEQMVKYRNTAKQTANLIKSEFNQVPETLESIKVHLDQKENQIERVRKQVELLNQKYQEQRTLTSLDPKNPTYEDNEKSLKTLAVLQKQEAQLDKLVEASIALQQTYSETETRAQSLGEAVDRLNQGFENGSTVKGRTTTLLNKLRSQLEQLSESSQKLSFQVPKPFQKLNQTLNQSKNIMSRFTSLFHKSTRSISNSARGSGNAISGMGRSMRGLARNLIVFQLIGRGIRQMASSLWSTLKTNDQFNASLNQIKGNLLTAFYPIYTAIIPAINALMSALAKLTGYLASFIATLFGTTFTAAKQGAQGLYESAQATDSVGSSAGSAKKKVDKLRRALMGFDEINRIGLDEDIDDDLGGGGSGGGGTPGGIDWGNVVDPGVPKWLQNIIDLLHDFFKPFKDAWDKYGYRVIEEWQYMLGEVIGLAKAIGKSFMEVWTNGTGERFIGNILLLLAEVLGIIGDVARAFRIAWEDGGRGTALIQSIFDAWNAILELLIVITQTFRTVWNDQTGVNIAKHLLEIFTNLHLTIAYLADGLKEAWLENLAGERIVRSILGIFEDNLRRINYMTEATKEWAKNLDFRPLLESIAVLLEALRPLTDRVGDGLAWFYTNVLLPLSAWTITNLLPTFLDVISALLTLLTSVIDGAKPGFMWFWDNFLVPIAQWTGGIIIAVLEKLAEWLFVISSWCRENEAVIQAITIAALTMGTAWLTVKGILIAFNAVLGIYKVIASGAAIATLILKAPFLLVAAAVIAVVGVLVYLYEKFEWFRNVIDPIVDGIKGIWNGFLKLFGKGTKEASDEASEAIDDLDKKSGKSTKNMSTETVGNVHDLQDGTISALNTTNSEGSDIMFDFLNNVTGSTSALASNGISDVGLFQTDTLSLLDTTHQQGSNTMDDFSNHVIGSTDDLTTSSLANLDTFQTGALSTLDTTKDKGSNTMDQFSKNVTGSMGDLQNGTLTSLNTTNKEGSKTVENFSKNVTGSMNTLSANGVSSIEGMQKDTLSALNTTHSQGTKTMNEFSNTVTSSTGTLAKNVSSDMNSISTTSNSSFNQMNRDVDKELKALNQASNKGLSDLESTFKRVLKNIQSNTRQIFNQILRDMQSSLSNLSSNMRTIGQNAMMGLNNGLMNGRSKVLNTARSIANDVAKTMQKALDINSPSRVLRDDVGRWIPEGIAVGIEENSGSVLSSLYEIVDDVGSLDLKIPDVFYDEPVIRTTRQADTSGFEGAIESLINTLMSNQKTDESEQEIILQVSESVLGKVMIKAINKEIRKTGITPINI